MFWDSKDTGSTGGLVLFYAQSSSNTTWNIIVFVSTGDIHLPIRPDAHLLGHKVLGNVNVDFTNTLCPSRRLASGQTGKVNVDFPNSIQGVEKNKKIHHQT